MVITVDKDVEGSIATPLDSNLVKYLNDDGGDIFGMCRKSYTGIESKIGPPVVSG